VFTQPVVIRRRRSQGLAASLACHGALMIVAFFVGTSNPPPPRTHASAPVIVPADIRNTSAGHPLPGLTSSEPYSATTLALPDSPPDFRNFGLEYSKIAARTTLLFPFLVPGIDLKEFGGSEDAHVGAVTFAGFANAGASHRPSLEINDRDMQKLADRAWSRRYRWNAFQTIVTLTETYDANHGALPTVMHMYAKQNALQPYADAGVRDYRLWVQLGIAADQVDFIGFISRYVNAHPASKTSVELLFLLDMLAQGSLDDLLTLLQTQPGVDLRWTWRTSKLAFEAMVKIRAFYDRELRRMNLASPAAVTTYYRNIRLAILRQVLAVTPDGDGANEARFKIGTILWFEHRQQEAVQMWRSISACTGDRTYGGVCPALRAAVESSIVNTKEIERVMSQEQAAWLSFSFDRLRRFGFRFDTF